MKERTILQSLIASAALGALVLLGGCHYMNKDTAVCPTCDKTVRTFHPKKGTQYRKVHCTECKQVVTINDAGEVTGTAHLCDACGELIGVCPACSKKM